MEIPVQKVIYSKGTRMGVCLRVSCPVKHFITVMYRERSNGRLGLGDGNFPNTAMNEGVPYPIRLRIPGVRIVHLEAGGM